MYGNQKAVSRSVTIPVIASSGAGGVAHFSEVFETTDVEAALAAGIFHRKEVPIASVKAQLKAKGIETRAASGVGVTRDLQDTCHS